MRVDITLDHDLAAYARVPIAYDVRETFQVAQSGEACVLTPQPVQRPYVKDYDADGGSPAAWAARFDLAHWRIFAAHVDGRRVGGAAVVLRAPDVDVLGGAMDVALLWDIRVAPDVRGRGVGRALLAAAESWAAENGAKFLDVETQNINVPACRFYSANGFTLRSVDRNAYPTLPDEIQLVWRKAIG